MRFSLPGKDDGGANALFEIGAAPLAVALGGVLILALPLRLFESAVPTPLIPLLAIYHWSARTPDRIPAPAVLLIGLLQDFLLGAPIGLFACAYLAVRWLVLSQDDFLHGRDRMTLWGGFALASAAATLILWISASASAGRIASIAPAAYQMAFTVLLYPPFAALFDRLDGRADAETI